MIKVKSGLQIELAFELNDQFKISKCKNGYVYLAEILSQHIKIVEYERNVYFDLKFKYKEKKSNCQKYNRLLESKVKNLSNKPSFK